MIDVNELRSKNLTKDECVKLSEELEKQEQARAVMGLKPSPEAEEIREILKMQKAINDKLDQAREMEQI